MDKFKRVLVVVILGIINLCILINNTLSEENHSNNSDVKVDETKEMLETLMRERAELDKLRLKLIDTVKKKEEEIKSREENRPEKKREVILTNFVKESVKDRENHADGQGNLSSHKNDVVAKESIIRDNGDGGAGNIKKVINKGDKIIHPFEIAESLYKSGEYKEALGIYKLIIKNNVEKEKKMWVTYQIANCYRKTGLYNDALEVYREMRQEYEGTYWSKQAQWYIQDIEWRSGVEEKLDSVIKR